MSALQISRQVRRRLDRFIDKKRRQGMPEKTVVQIMLDALIELMNERDGDPDAEDEPEFAGVDLAVLAALEMGDATDAEDTHDAEDNREDDEDSGGEDLSQGYGYPPGSEDDAEPDCDDERSHNAPVSAVYLGLDVTGEAVP